MAYSRASAPGPIRFGIFEFEKRTLELRKNGSKVRIEGQPLQVLALLVERHGQLVTREELQQKLWPTDTFVSFEQGINSGIRRLREVLDDSAQTPRFIETLPRRGYRFIYPLNGDAAPHPWLHRRGLQVPALGAVVLTVFAIAALSVPAVRQRFFPAPARITSVAVLPLENLTGDPEQEYLVDGIHDELVTQVAQISALKVISRTSVLRYKQTKLPLRQVARELGVDAIMEGAVQRNGDRLHVSAQLIYAPNDRHLWARSYERSMAEIPGLPAEIAASLAQDLHIDVTPQEHARLADTQPVNPEVYKLYLEGSYYQKKWTNESLKKAIELFRQALDLDPSYAPAWVGLGNAYDGLGSFAKGSDLSAEEARSRAKAALERALELDPALRGPHDSLAWMKRKEGDLEGSAREYELARRLDPAWPGPLRYLLATERFDEAVAASRWAAERDPLAYNVQLIHGWTLFMASRFDESIAQLKKTVQLDPAIHYAHFELAWNYVKKGMYEDAVLECDTATVLFHRKQPEELVTECGWVYAATGRRQQALEIVRTLERSDDEGRFGLLSRIYDALGDRERALAYLKQHRHHNPMPTTVGHRPFYSDGIKADPRFREIVRQVREYPPPFGALAEVRGSAPAPTPAPRRP